MRSFRSIHRESHPGHRYTGAPSTVSSVVTVPHASSQGCDSMSLVAMESILVRAPESGKWAHLPSRIHGGSRESSRDGAKRADFGSQVRWTPPLQLHPGTVTDDVTPVDRPAHRGSTMEA